VILHVLSETGSVHSLDISERARKKLISVFLLIMLLKWSLPGTVGPWPGNWVMDSDLFPPSWVWG
jgi:hypothetical protein